MGKMSFLLWFLLLVHGVLGDKVTVRVTKGEDVTLPSSTEVQRNDQILWKFKALSALKDSLIVRVDEEVGIYTTSIDGRFRDRLKMDNKTGSLTITSVTSEDAGIYQLDINNDNGTNLKQFDVTVHEDVESKSVTEGDSVTLQTGVTDKQRDDLIVWKFNDEVIRTAELNNRDGRWSNVHLNDQTGELEFTRIQRTQSGLYEVESNTSRLILHRKFRVTVDVVEPRIREGDTVTLHTGVPQIQEGGQIVWKFKNKIIYPSKGSDDTSWSNFHLNDQTGGLTITHIRIDQSGDYEVEINKSSMILHRIFHINISGEMKTVSVREGEPIILHTGLYEKQGYDLILWKFGDRPIANQLLPNDSSDERFKGRLWLYRESGDLIIRDSRSTDSGVYHLDMSSSTYSVQRSISATVSDKPSPVSGLSSGAVAGIVVGLLLVLLLVVFAAVIVAGVICCPHKIIKLITRRYVEKKETNVPLNAETVDSGAS